MNLGGVSRGYLDFVQQDRARQQQDMQGKLIMQQFLQAQQAAKARQQWGPVLEQLMGGQGQQPGVPPPPGSPAGGPMPPGPGVSSQPMAPPAPPGPPGIAPGAPGGMGAIPPPPGAGAPPMAAAPNAAPPVAPPTPYKPMPTSPQVPAPAGAVPPPPVGATPPGAGTPPGPPPGQQFGLQQILQGLKQANVPPDQWGTMLDNLPEPIKNAASQEITMLKTQNDLLVKWARERNAERGTDIKEKSVDAKIDVDKQRLQLAAQKVGLDEAKVEIAQKKLKDAEQNDAVQFDQQDISYWTEVVKDGGSLPPGLARTVGGRKLIQSVMHGVAGGGGLPSEMLANQAELQGLKAGERTLGTRSANIELAANEAGSLADLALMASNSVPRTNVTKANEWIQLFEKGTSDPELRAFVAANTSLINAYARAINPQGVGTVADKEHAREMLGTAFPKGDYSAAVNQLMQEIAAAKKSPGTVKSELRERFTDSKGGATAPSGRKVASPEAIADVKAHPERAAEFSSYYGYLPPGVRQ